MRKYFSKNKNTRGFTLVEALVAISILLISVVGPLSIVSTTINEANVAKDQVVAFYLAQEAVEYVRNARDKNILTGQTNSNWLTGFTGSGGCSATDGHTCYLDPVTATIAQCTTNHASCPKLNFVTDNSNNLSVYSYISSGVNLSITPTTFVRSITVTPDATNPDREATVSVKVSWTTGVLPLSFTISEHLYNWR